MYTGMNFLPLCTAIVCPTISGRIVERRDHVFTTFFSFRAFNASTFTRSGSSTNGPFFSERGIFFLFLHPAQLHPLRPAHFPEASHRTWNAVRDRAERTHKPSPLRIRYLFNDHGPTSLAQAKQCLGCGRKLRRHFRGGLCCGLRPAPRRCFPRARGSPCCTPRCSCGCHKVALCSPPRRIHFASTLRSTLCSALRFYRKLHYGRRSTIIRSLLRFFRVFAPRVGNPQGVCGWLPFTRPSPPPCGWSTGFIATPRTVGRLPCQRVRPAFPYVTFSWSRLPSWPIVAIQSTQNFLTSPDGSFTSAKSPSLLNS